MSAIEFMDVPFKREYEHAKEIVPNLVSSETPTINFLRTDNYDPERAATRLVLYWKYRKDIFGDRWLLPMTQTGRGALTQPEIQMLRTGFLHTYPVGKEEYLCVMDYSKLPGFLEYATSQKWNISRLYDRVTMYYSTIACNEWVCQVKGLTLIHLVNSKKRPILPFREEMWQIFRNAFPFKVRRCFVAQSYEPDKPELLHFVRYQTCAIFQHNSKMAPIEIYADSVRRTVQKLVRHGVSKRFVPDDLGGDFVMNTRIPKWVQDRLTFEELTDVTPTAYDIVTKKKMLGMKCSRKQGSQLVKRKSSQVESEADFYKRRNAAYSRRLYHKRKLEILSLEEDVKMLISRNKVIRDDNERLQFLLFQAQKLVDLMPTSVNANSLAYSCVPPGLTTAESAPCFQTHYDEEIQACATGESQALCHSEKYQDYACKDSIQNQGATNLDAASTLTVQFLSRNPHSNVFSTLAPLAPNFGDHHANVNHGPTNFFE